MISNGVSNAISFSCIRASIYYHKQLANKDAVDQFGSSMQSSINFYIASVSEMILRAAKEGKIIDLGMPVA
jgi:hypothetical protein